MRITIPALLLSVAPLCVSCSDQKHQDNTVDQTELSRNFAALRDRRIFFGHQSVGADLIAGIQMLQNDLPEQEQVKVIQVGMREGGKPGPAPHELPEAFFAETKIGRNGSPQEKCEDFVRLIGETFGGRLDAAVMKYCFADIKSTTDVAQAFAVYRGAVTRVREAYPGIRLVHVTVPLTIPTAGWKRLVKKLLGKEGNNDLDNARRGEFNAMLRSAYAGEPIFDLARAESTLPDGSRALFTYEGKTYEALAPDYATPDGGHLNSTGRVAAASAFLAALAAAVSPVTAQN